MAAAVDADTFAGDEFGFDQEYHRARDLFRATPPPKRRRLDDTRGLLGGEIRRRENWPGRDRVNQNLGRQLEGEALGKRRSRSFRSVVRHVTLIARSSAYRQPVAEVH